MFKIRNSTIQQKIREYNWKENANNGAEIPANFFQNFSISREVVIFYGNSENAILFEIENFRK